MAQYLLMKDDTGYWKDQFSGECFDFDPLIIKNTDFEPANVEAVLLYLDRSNIHAMCKKRFELVKPSGYFAQSTTFEAIAATFRPSRTSSIAPSLLPSR